MKHGKRKWNWCRRAAVAAMAAGTVFQVSSCNIDEGGVISAFADPGALSDLRNQLIAASPLGQLFSNVAGSLEVSIGETD